MCACAQIYIFSNGSQWFSFLNVVRRWFWLAKNSIKLFVCIDWLDERQCWVLFFFILTICRKKFLMKKILFRHTVRVITRTPYGWSHRVRAWGFSSGRGGHQFDWPKKNAAPPCARSPSCAVRSKYPPPPHAHPGGPRPAGNITPRPLVTLRGLPTDPVCRWIGSAFRRDPQSLAYSGRVHPARPSTSTDQKQQKKKKKVRTVKRFSSSPTVGDI